MSSSAGQRWILCGGANHASAPEDALLGGSGARRRSYGAGASGSKGCSRGSRVTVYEIVLRGDWVTVPADCTEVVFTYEARREWIRERFLKLNRIGCTT